MTEKEFTLEEGTTITHAWVVPGYTRFDLAEEFTAETDCVVTFELDLETETARVVRVEAIP